MEARSTRQTSTTITRRPRPANTTKRVPPRTKPRSRGGPLGGGACGVAFTAVGAPIEEGVWRPAEAMADESERAMLSAPAAGIVAAIHVAPGREVAAGTPLLALRSPELADLTAAGSRGARCASRRRPALAREERLAAARAGAARELEAARMELAVARAEEAAARLALEARGVTREGRRDGRDPRAQARAGGELRVLVGAGGRGRAAARHVRDRRATLVRRRAAAARAGSLGARRADRGAARRRPTLARRASRAAGRRSRRRPGGSPTACASTASDPPLAGTPLEVRVPLRAGDRAAAGRPAADRG